MEMLSANQLNKHSFSPSSKTVHSSELLKALTHYASKIKILSLDCFDTLIWRMTASPIDVFYDLQEHPAFKSLGFTALLRMHAESNARKMKNIQATNTEVQLQDIYLADFPTLSNEQLDALVEAEISQEIASCYAFPPIVELIRKAHAMNLKVIIVSDTYLQKNQLERLLINKLPPDVFAAIDMIICSCEHKRSKSQGLFKYVLNKFNCPNKSILHIGDNIDADYHAPDMLGIRALRLLHHEEETIELLRLQAAAAGFIDPTIRYTRSLCSPFRGFYATANYSTKNPAQMLGFGSIGPIMYAFGKFICDEIEALKNAGKNPKVLFLLRDAHLPFQACSSLSGTDIGKEVFISRFAGLAASFRTTADVDRYLADAIYSNRFADMANQLQIPKEIAMKMVNQALAADKPQAKFNELIHQPEMLSLIFQYSTEYRQRLIKYLEKEIDLKPHDLLVFVDLGYSGTVQRQLEPVFREELQVEIIGRYLIALTVPGWQTTRRGLLDPSCCDDRAMRTLTMYIALLEQISTANEKSVVDYDTHGNPIFIENKISEKQYNQLKPIQDECIRFIHEVKQFLAETHATLPLQMLRDVAMSELGRIIFLPTKSEVDYLENFQFDLNLGTTDTFSMFDRSKGLESLRRRGIFSLFLERNAKTFRTNTPTELRMAGIELSLSLAMQHRFSLNFNLQDLNLRREPINVLVMRGKEHLQTLVEAQATHDGFFSLTIPLGDGQMQLGFLFGQKYHWLQIENAESIDLRAFLTESESQYIENCSDKLIFQNMTDHGGKLYECTSLASFVMFVPHVKINETTNYVLRLTFRPIVWRETLEVTSR